MEQMILKISQFIKDEWMVAARPETVKFEEGGIVVTQEPEGECVIVYRDVAGKMRSIGKVITKEKYNTYSIKHEISTIGDIEVWIGVSKYYINGTSEMKYYEKDEVISLLTEGIEGLYLTLKVRGSGKVILKTLAVEAKEKLFLNEAIHKAKKLEAFYEWHEKRIDEEQKIIPRLPIKIAAILDEFSFECWKYEADILPLTYQNWEKEIQAFEPQLLLVESAWQGKNGSWTNRIARYGVGYDEEVARLVAYCNQNQIPTLFWDKEGLKNFHYFISTANLFDYVAATDENVLEIHQVMRERDKVFILPFAAQPKIHNVEGRKNFPLGAVAFAGSWYGEKYPDRIKEMDRIVKPAIGFGLDIYDRNYDKQSTLEEEVWKWPECYRKCIVGKLPYTAMIEAYKQYSVFLNVQSLNDSDWMIPRRVYEILACGIPVVSSYSKGLHNQFNGDVYLSKSEEDTKRILKWILEHPVMAIEKADRVRRKVLKEHTYEKRMEVILEKINLP